MTLDLFNQPPLPEPTGNELRDLGMKVAVEHADKKEEKWSEKAYLFLLEFIKSGNEFMIEDVRKASEGIINEPPSLRAWGAIIVRASKARLIKRVGFKNVTNPKAHSTPASVWKKINN